MSYINLDTFDYKLKKDFSQFGSCITEDSAEKSASVVAESKSKVLQENVKPCNHSSPYEKSLSPVRRMFSSSSRLDKNYQPLTNPKRCNFQSTKPKPQAQNRYNGQPLADCFGGALKNGCFKLNNHSNLLRRQSMSIDLPNDDPFDKVKKWQASLPSINLLGTHSSSDCEELEHHSPDPCPCESNPVKCSLAKNGVNESEICNILSQELKNKCIITEMEVDMEPEFSIMKNNDDITKSSKKENQVNTHLSTFRTGDEEVKPLFINNNCLSSNNRYVIHLKQQNKTKKSLNCPMRENFVEERLPSSELESKNTELVPLWSRESSESEDCSTHLPKSSSISNRRINKIEDSENSDDSSSVSSSVLGSDSPSVMGSSKRVKRRLVLCEDKFSSKVPKITKSKSSQTTFILKEAMLNFTPPMENNRAQIKNQISSKNMSTNYETWYKHRHSSHPPIISVMTESSQRKAWNARNNANFYVCKDFPFTKSTSLMECIKDMEGLVSKGSLVIRSVVDRNNSRPTC